MLSYQHAYHAGNAADLHKHSALAELLALLTRKPRPVSYLESHAGRGLYDLSGPEAAKTGEAARGIARAAPGDGPFWQALATIRQRHGPDAYPGSPAIAQALLRPQDKIQLCELHPAEFAALKSAMGAKVALHRRDGHEGLRALTPPKPRRGLALIDPSYEVKQEYGQTAATALAVLANWPEAVVMVWYPLLPAARHEAMAAQMMASAPLGSLRHEVRFRDRPARGMTGAGLVILNAPYGAEARLRRAWENFSDVFLQV